SQTGIRYRSRGPIVQGDQVDLIIGGQLGEDEGGMAVGLAPLRCGREGGNEGEVRAARLHLDGSFRPGLACMEFFERLQGAPCAFLPTEILRSGESVPL